MSGEMGEQATHQQADLRPVQFGPAPEVDEEEHPPDVGRRHMAFVLWMRRGRMRNE